MEIVEQEPEPESEMPQTAARTSAVVRKQKGAYRLSDFIIQRTLGTGSFGRVHLGVSSEELTIFLLADHLPGCSAEQT